MLLENSHACTLRVVGHGLGHTRAYPLTFNHENVIIYFIWGVDYWERVTYLGVTGPADSGVTQSKYKDTYNDYKQKRSLKDVSESNCL